MTKVCSIVGAFSKKGDNVASLIVNMIKATHHRGPDDVGICIGGEVIKAESAAKLNLARTRSDIGIGSARLAILGDNKGRQPIAGCKDYFIVLNGEIYNYRELGQSLMNHRITTSTDTEVVLHVFEDYLRKSNLVVAMRKTMCDLDGMYAFALFLDDKLIVSRDPVGIKPLYLTENESLVAFASERKALWAIGLVNNICPLKPGNFAIIGRKGLKTFRGITLEKSAPAKITFGESQYRVYNLLTKSIKKRVKYRRLGILFSGGLDSYLIAYLAQALGANVELYCSGFQGSRDIQNAIDSAKKIGLPLHIYELDLEEVEEYLPKILYAIEERNPMNLSIAIPIFFSTKMAKQKSIKVMLSGQGSDEIFGGYTRYEKIVTYRGYQSLHEQLWQDVQNIAERNLQREDATSMANSIEIRVPFLDLELLKFAMAVPPEYKIKRNHSSYTRKYILRSVAKRLNIPEDVANRSKVATQYGSGSWKALHILARKNRFSKQSAKRRGYKNHIQMYIDALSSLAGIP